MEKTNKIFILENDQSSYKVLKTLLTHQGYRTHHLTCAQDVHASIKTRQPDLLILNTEFSPDFCLEVTKSIRNNHSTSSIPVIIIIHKGDEKFISRGIDAGADDFLVKPYQELELLARIRSLLRSKYIYDELQREKKDLKSILEISRGMLSLIDTNAILFLMVREVAQNIKDVRSSIILFDRAKKTGYVKASHDDPEIENLKIKIRNYPEIGSVLETGKPAIIQDISRDPIMSRVKEILKKVRINSILAIPIKFQEEIMGTLLIRAVNKKEKFTSREIDFCQLIANASASAIKNAELFENLKDEARKREEATKKLERAKYIEKELKLKEKYTAELKKSYTQLERSKKELQIANEELKKLDKLKSEFLQNVSHELRTPLTPIMGYLKLLLKEDFGNLNAMQEESIRSVMDSTKRLHMLIEELITIASLETDNIMLRIHEVSTSKLLEGCISEALPSIAQKEITLSRDIAPDVSDIKGDFNRLHQVINNLIRNAVKFTERNGKITVGACNTAHKKGFVKIWVQDTGIGIGKSDQKKIFERFYQVDGSMTRKYEGMGLGLAIVRKLVKAHGGTIDVISRKNAGTTFTVFLPGNDS